ncbi:5'-nucleotidase C-terminal domain-containing protein [Labilibaculum sp. DW002]|uniref:5'-nucleotidase C-terminal domain-containing protein n=1 Tax=Paralabilibaculum antarcticum TaxID=2912572 RepID=A0ABT5VYF5_9BACT|nr:5'-nucleotidase C-terminal domain-containing protein [Labilibaculum sp. DW002]MDE5420376.1 5'-nucleotidase C-terminal domain-containing protein [Labilibaculum sp. DW002]
MTRNISFLIFFITSLTLNAQKVDLIYFTDAHQIFPVDDVDGGRGGVARLKTIVDEVKNVNENTLVIHGGDLCGGVLFGGMYKGEPMIEAFNDIPVDICNFGQHEFDFGSKHTIQLLSKSKSQWFSSNLKNRDGEVFGNLPAFLVKELGGLKIGFIGLTDAMNTSIKDDLVIQEDLFASVSDVISQLSNLDFIVLLSQTNLDTNRKLIEQFPEIDLILTEEQYEQESNVFYKGHVPVVSTAGNMSSVAKISLGENKKILVDIIPLDQKVASEKYMRDMEVYYKKDMELQLSEKICELEVPLNFRDGIIGESLAGNLISDAFKEWHDSNVGMINGGGIRADISAGDFMLKSARSLLPFGNKICQIIIKGSELKKVLRNHASDKKGALLHVSGITYAYKDSLITVLRNGIELDDEELLTVSLNSFLLERLDADFEILIDKLDPEAIADYDVLKAYCKKHKLVKPVLEKRISLFRNE